jgi:prepilin-type N-terminal cleavage/methylation domain-containing protein
MALHGGVAGPRDEAGYTLIEVLATLTILVTVLTSLTALFTAASKAQLETNRRFEAQQNARTAVDRLRREVHCASEIEITGPNSVTLTLPGGCPTAVGGAETLMVYDTEEITSTRFKLRRDESPIADYLTTGDVFAYTPPSTAALGRLNVDLPVNVRPNEGWKTWRLRTDIALRNTTRT